MYIYLSNTKISFSDPAIFFHFPSSVFVYSFMIFNLLFSIILYFLNKKQRVLNFTLGVFAILISTLIYSYLDVTAKIYTISKNLNASIELQYNDVNYDLIFLISLFLGLLPSIISLIKNYKYHRTPSHSHLLNQKKFS